MPQKEAGSFPVTGHGVSGVHLKECGEGQRNFFTPKSYKDVVGIHVLGVKQIQHSAFFVGSILILINYSILGMLESIVWVNYSLNLTFTSFVA